MFAKKMNAWVVASFPVIYVFFCFVSNVESYFNLFMSAEEMKRILGLSKELYYVREGVLNEYALNFVVTVPAHINSLHFTWQALGRKPLPYSSSIESSDTLAMEKPLLNIPLNGLIPFEPNTFQILLPCTGDLSGEVEVKLTIKVTFFMSPRIANVTTVSLKRKKICLEDSEERNTTFGNVNENSPTITKDAGQDSENRNDHKLSGKNETREENFGMISVINDDAIWDWDLTFIVVGFSFTIMIFLIVVTCGAVFVVRTRKINSVRAESSRFLHMDTSGSSTSTSAYESGGSGTLFLRSESPHYYSSISQSVDPEIYSYSTFYPSNHPGTFYSEISNTYKSNEKSNIPKSNPNGTLGFHLDHKLIDKITIPRCKVRLQRVIMEGTFGRIYNATVLDRNGSEKKVIVKTVCDHSSPVQMTLLLHDGLSLLGLVHEYLLSLIGVATEESVPPFLIYQDEGFRNLKRFLQRCQGQTGTMVSTQEMVQIALQVGTGIAFLHKQNLIHGDMSCRNCVIDENMNVKITDSALSKDLFPEDYHWTSEGESRPIKWLAPELLYNSRTSLQGDVWSFGVFLWELTTFAQQPYSEILPEEMFSFLKMNYRLLQPIDCPDEMYSTMMKCWRWESDERPKWTHLLQELQSIHTQLVVYV